MIDKDRSATIAGMIQGSLNMMLGDIPAIGRTRVNVSAGSRTTDVTAVFRGWSPTLHSITVSRDMHLDTLDMSGVTARDPRDIADEAAAALLAVVERQRDRAADAALLGRGRPFEKTDLGHLYVDVAFPALREASGRRPGQAKRAEALEAVRRAHAGSAKHTGGATMRSSGVFIGEHCDNDGRWTRVVLPHVRLWGGGGTSDGGRPLAALRGFEIEARSDRLPEAVLISLVGRPLSDLAAFHPSIADRTIRRATNAVEGLKPGFTLTIDANVDPIDEVLKD